MREITVSASPDQLDRLMEFINEQLEEFSCPDEVRFDLNVIVDELFSNIFQFAYGPEPGTVTVRVERESDPPAAVLTFEDRGAPFNPLTEERPDLSSQPARERPVGGLGIFLVRKRADQLSYTRQGGKNILTVRKALKQIS